MPHIRVRNLDEAQMQKLSEGLIAPLAKALQTGEDNFTLEKVSGSFYEKGQLVPSYPFVEILWFARSQEVQDLAALLVTNQIRSITGAVDITVVFQVLDKTAYYENGSHF